VAVPFRHVASMGALIPRDTPMHANRIRACRWPDRLACPVHCARMSPVRVQCSVRAEKEVIRTTVRSGR
jgi:hypothetical protein